MEIRNNVTQEKPNNDSDKNNPKLMDDNYFDNNSVAKSTLTKLNNYKDDQKTMREISK